MENNDNQVTLAPEPDKDTSAHGQAASSISPKDTEIPTGSTGLVALSLSQNLLQLGNNESKRYGLQTIFVMAASWAEETNKKLDILTQVTNRLEIKEETTRRELADVREDNATLRAQAQVKQQHKPLLATAVFASPTLIAIAIDQIRSENWGVGIALLIVGIFLAISVYVSYERGDK